MAPSRALFTHRADVIIKPDAFDANAAAVTVLGQQPPHPDVCVGVELLALIVILICSPRCSPSSFVSQLCFVGASERARFQCGKINWQIISDHRINLRLIVIIPVSIIGSHQT